MNPICIIVPDVHGRPFWKEALPYVGKVHIIFLGDFLDPYYYDKILWGVTPESAYRCLQEIIALKEEHPEDVTLLLGNHDCQYLYGPDVCFCRCDEGNFRDITRTFREHKDLFRIASETEAGGRRFMFSHAGISPGWSEQNFNDLTSDDVVAYLNDMNREALRVPNPGKTAFARALAQCDRERSGNFEHGSVVWADAEVQNLDWQFGDVIHVVGHTVVNDWNPVMTDAFWFTDCSRCFILGDDGFLYHMDGTPCANPVEDNPLEKEPWDYDTDRRLALDRFDRPYCRVCGSRDIIIRGGMMTDSWYCKDCHIKEFH